MLKNFFQLNRPFKEFCNFEDLRTILRHSDSLRDVAFMGDNLTQRDLDGETKLFSNKTFTNVSFSKTNITGVIFRNCIFKDCLFQSTQFNQCEFHECTFNGCNPNKIQFNNTYIDPAIFQGMIDHKKHPNIGIHLFHNLYNNAIRTNQPQFARTAQFNMRIWERYVLTYQYRHKRWFHPPRVKKWISNYASYLLIGYGIRARFWLRWAFVICVLSTIFNIVAWDHFDVVAENGAPVEESNLNVIYYTFTILGGLPLLTPNSNFGKVVFMFEAGFGLIIVAVLIAWLIRLVLR